MLAEAVFNAGGLALRGAVTFHTVATLLTAIEQNWRAQAQVPNHFSVLTVDCGAVSEVDSSAVSLLLAILRLGEELGLAVRVVNVSDDLRSLIGLYEVEWLLQQPPEAIL